mmetsp:Transcript_44715/g.106108  ORF Transcript_44715/g.106108 Transcript_44715/m.106108 type:complete len:1137 (+) Transcript_44715:60-3470(+)
MHGGPLIPVHRYVYVDPLWLDARDSPPQPLGKKAAKDVARHKVLRSPPPSREGLSCGGLTVGGLPRVDKRRAPALPHEREHASDRKKYSFLLTHSNVAEDVSMQSTLPTKYSTLFSKQEKPPPRTRPVKGHRNVTSLCHSQSGGLWSDSEYFYSDDDYLCQSMTIRSPTGETRYAAGGDTRHDRSGGLFGSRSMPSLGQEESLPPITSAKRGDAKKHVVAIPMKSSDEWPDVPPAFSQSLSQGPPVSMRQSVDKASSGSPFDSTHSSYSPRLPVTAAFSPGSTGNTWRGSGSRPANAEWNDALLRIMPLSEWETRPRKPRTEASVSHNESFMSSSCGQSTDGYEDLLDPFPFTSFSVEGYGLGNEQRSSLSFSDHPGLRRCRTAPDIVAAARNADDLLLSMQDAHTDLKVRRMSLYKRPAARRRSAAAQKRILKEWLPEDWQQRATPPAPFTPQSLHENALLAGWESRTPSHQSWDAMTDVERASMRRSLESVHALSEMRSSDGLQHGQDELFHQDEHSSVHSDRKSSKGASQRSSGMIRHHEDVLLQGSRGPSWRESAGSGSAGGGSFGGAMVAPLITVNAVASADGLLSASKVTGTSDGTSDVAAPLRTASKAPRGSHLSGGDTALLRRKGSKAADGPEADGGVDILQLAVASRSDLGPTKSSSSGTVPGDDSPASSKEGGEGRAKHRKPQRLTTKGFGFGQEDSMEPTQSGKERIGTASSEISNSDGSGPRRRHRSKARTRTKGLGSPDTASPRSQFSDDRPMSAGLSDMGDEDLLGKLQAKQKQREEEKKRESRDKKRREKDKERSKASAVADGEEDSSDAASADASAVEAAEAEGILKEAGSTSHEGDTMGPTMSRASAKASEPAQDDEDYSLGGDSSRVSRVSSVSTLDAPPLFKTIANKVFDARSHTPLLPGHRLEASGHGLAGAAHHKRGPQIAGAVEQESSGSSTPTADDLWEDAGQFLFWDADDPNRLARRFRDTLAQVWMDTPEPQTPESEREAREWEILLAMPVNHPEELWKKAREKLPEISLQGMLRRATKERMVVEEQQEEEAAAVHVETLHEVYSKMNVKRHVQRLEAKAKVAVDHTLQTQRGGPAGVWGGRLQGCKRQLGTLNVFAKGGHRATQQAAVAV